MALNLTKGKTKKLAGTIKPVRPDTAETIATIAHALRPSALTGMVNALTAAVGAAAAEKEPSTPEPAKPKADMPATPLHKFPVADADVDLTGGELLLRNVMQAKAMGACRIVQEQVVMSHDRYGVISLRMVEYDSGLLIGLIDTNKATYCECEWFAGKTEAVQAWKQWLAAAAY